MTDVTCAAGVEHLMDYLEGVLSPQMRATLETHVAGCARCTAFLASYRETPRIVRQATDASMPERAKKALDELLRGLRGGHA